MTDWKNKFNIKVTDAAEAVARINPGWRVFVGGGCGEPSELVGALAARVDELVDVEIMQMITLGEGVFADEKMAGGFRINNFYVTRPIRDAINSGRGAYTPISMSDIPDLFSSGRIPIDAVLLMVSPPDESGMCSLGVSVDVVGEAVANAGLVIAEINPNMPRTSGESLINIHDFDYAVEANHPLIEASPENVSEETTVIGRHVASLIEDGACLQIGPGLWPQLSTEAIRGKKDIGLHTEMVSDSVIDMIASGSITGARKNFDAGKIVTSFAIGSKRLFDYLDGNDAFSFRATDYVNDPKTISRLDKVTAINLAREIDLTGQVCGDSVGSDFFGGFGGIVDFNTGATLSPGGKSIIVLPSRARDGSVSRIVATLSPGSGVIGYRSAVHYVVTEYGIAYLHGESIESRALALISIAHPDFRAELIEQAIKLKYLSPDMAEVEGKMFVEPPGLRTTLLLDDGSRIKLRPIHPTDEPRMRDLFYRLSEGTVYYRFGKKMKHFPQQQIKDFVYIDHRNEVSIVGGVETGAREEIISLGVYYLDQETNRAEIALVTADNWQGKGIGAVTMKHMINIARRNGIRGFTAEIHTDNKPMMRLMQKSGGKMQTTLKDEVYSIILDF